MVRLTQKVRAFVVGLALLPVVLTACAADGSSDAALDRYGQISADFSEMREERLRLIVGCMEDQGFAGMSVLPDGTTEISLPDEQLDVYNQAASLCLKQVCDSCGSGVSREAWEQVYHLQVAAASCLRTQGQSVSEAPTLQVYLETPEEAKWSPHGEVLRASPQQQSALKAACPDPLDFVTYLG